MLSIIDRMDLKSRLRPLREGDMYEINGKNYYSEELLFARLSENEEMDGAAIADLIDERDDLIDERDDLIAERDEARDEASLLRTAGVIMQRHGVQFPFNDHLFPWEGQEENENG